MESSMEKSSPSGFWIATTHPGVSFLLIEEWQALMEAQGFAVLETETRQFGMRGMVGMRIAASPAQVEPLLPQLRLAHHLFRYLQHLTLPDLRDFGTLEAALQRLPLPEMVQAESFRITTNRVGQQAYDSYAVASMAGRVVNQRFGTAVKMKGYDRNLRVDVYDQMAWIGWQLTRQSLAKRFDGRPYLRSVALQPPMAQALLRLAGIPEDQPVRLHDPFCGSGTILIEAAQTYPQIDLSGSDRYEEATEGSQQNMAHFGLADRIPITQVDVRDLSQYIDAESLDYVVTNPPFGLRMAQKVDLKAFYLHALQEIAHVLRPGGRLVLLMLKAAIFRQALSKAPFRLIKVLKVQVGGKNMRIYTLERE